ncbi:MAG: ribbon-helix-helix domain-containing protein [Pseudomonadota bacterium]
MDMGRKKIPIPVAIDPDLAKELDDWIAAQPVPPSRTAVIEAALRLFLQKNQGKK